MTVDGKEYSEGQLRMLFRALRPILTNDRNITRNNAALRATAVHIGLVTEEECDFG